MTGWKTMRRATYRAWIVDDSPGLPKYARGGVVWHAESWSFWDQHHHFDPIEDVRLAHESILKRYQDYILYGGYRSGKTLISLSAVSRFQIHAEMSNISRNLAKLMQRCTRRRLRKTRKPEKQHQQQQWRRNERLSNKKLPGR